MQRRAATDDGFTLIEVLIAVVILGLGVAALVAGLGTHAKVSLANRNQSQVATALTAAAEYVKSLPWSGFSTCSGSATTVPVSAVPRDAAFTVTYGPPVSQQNADGSQTSCSVLSVVPVHVVGGGFDVTTSVIKRPTDSP